VSRRNIIDLSDLNSHFPDAVATRADLVQLGVDPATVARRCRYGAPWRRLLPGVYSLHSGPPSRRQFVRAALLYAGPLSVVTGLEAVRRYGVRRIPDQTLVHILVPEKKGVSGRDFLLVERSRRPWKRYVRDGFPLAGPARAVIDAARREHRKDVVRALIADAVQRNICSIGQLNWEVRQQNLRGTAIPRRVLAEVGDGVRSVAEAWARSLISRSPLPSPEWNVVLRGPSGNFLGVVDAWWAEVGLAWEIDSKEFHLSPVEHERTTKRHSRLTAAGIIVVHTVPSRLKNEPAEVIEELRGAYEFASRRIRPAVYDEPTMPAA
jgi:hypothetical protein